MYVDCHSCAHHTKVAAGRNEKPFGRDTRVVPIISNSVLDRCTACPTEGEIWGSGPPIRSDAAYCQITLALVMIIFVSMKVVSIECPVAALDHKIRQCIQRSALFPGRARIQRQLKQQY